MIALLTIYVKRNAPVNAIGKLPAGDRYPPWRMPKFSARAPRPPHGRGRAANFILLAADLTGARHCNG